MEKKTIKIVSDKDEENLDLLSGIPQDIQESSGWYLHGKLEEYLGYDLGSIYNLEELSEDLLETVVTTVLSSGADKVKYVKRSHFNGIYPVEVLGVESPCIGYFWTTDEQDKTVTDLDGTPKSFKIWKQRGLVVLESDLKGKRYAEDCYIRKKDSI